MTAAQPAIASRTSITGSCAYRVIGDKRALDDLGKQPGERPVSCTAARCQRSLVPQNGTVSRNRDDFQCAGEARIGAANGLRLLELSLQGGNHRPRFW